MDQISEARRYVANAKEILRDKAQKQGNLYQDEKYVRMAGHTAYSGILIALDEVLGTKSASRRKDVSWYKSGLAKLDKRILNEFNEAYKLLHLSMSYDGARSVSVAKDGLQYATDIIDWVETRTAA